MVELGGSYNFLVGSVVRAVGGRILEGIKLKR